MKALERILVGFVILLGIATAVIVLAAIIGV